MTDDRVADFLAGDRTDDVALYVASDRLSNPEDLLSRPVARAAGDGVLLVVDGDTGRSVFGRVTGRDAMDFAGAAMHRDGEIDPSLAGGTCPDAPADDKETPHEPAFVFSFAEAQNEEVGGIYAEGAVIHAYAQCSCGTAYADKWVAGDR
ncbi:MAG: DUF5807 family protein [Halanaeroarchaeum sp.]